MSLHVTAALFSEAWSKPSSHVTTLWKLPFDSMGAVQRTLPQLLWSGTRLHATRSCQISSVPVSLTTVMLGAQLLGPRHIPEPSWRR